MIVEVLATAIIAAPIGFLTCAFMTAGKIGDEQTALAEHARLADAYLAKQARIDRLKDIASSQKSVKSARIVAVLDGDA